MLGLAAQDAPHLADGLVRAHQHEVGRHDSAGRPFAVEQERAQAVRLLGRHRGQQLGRLVLLQVAQGIDCFVGLHLGQQRGRLLGRRLAQQRAELIGFHLLERVRRGLRLELGEQLLALVATELLEQVGELTRPQAAQRLVRRVEPHRPGRSLGTTGAERLDRRPVDHPVRGRATAPAWGTEPAQQRLEADVHTDEPVLVADAGQVEVGGADDAHAVDVHELVVDDVAVEHHLTGPPLEVTQVETRPSCSVTRSVLISSTWSIGTYAPPTDPDDESGDGRVGLAPPADDEVEQAADLGAGAVAHRAADEAGDRDERVRDRAVGQETLGSVLTPATERGRSGKGWATSHDAPRGW